MVPPNKGHVGDNINSAVLSFIERLSSFQGSQCIKTIGNVILGPRAVSFVERSIIFRWVHYRRFHCTCCFHGNFTAYYICSGFSSVFSIILNPTTTNFTDQVDVTSLNGFFHSNAWLGATTCLSSVIGGQLIGLLADR